MRKTVQKRIWADRMACAVSGWSRRRQGLQLEQGERTGAGAFNGGSRLSGIKNAKYLLRRE